MQKFTVYYSHGVTTPSARVCVRMLLWWLLLVVLVVSIKPIREGQPWWVRLVRRRELMTRPHTQSRPCSPCFVYGPNKQRLDSLSKTGQSLSKEQIGEIPPLESELRCPPTRAGQAGRLTASSGSPRLPLPCTAADSISWDCYNQNRVTRTTSSTSRWLA